VKKKIENAGLPALVHQGETQKQLKEHLKEMMFSPKSALLRAR